MSKIVNTDGLKRFRQDIDKRYAVPDGVYENMSVGNADQLNSTLYSEDKEAYSYRAAGGSADIGNRLIDTLVGGSIVWSQYVLTNHSAVSKNGVSVKIENGVITMNGTASGSSLVSITDRATWIDYTRQISSGHLVLALLSNNSGYGTKWQIVNANNGVALEIRATALSDGTYAIKNKLTTSLNCQIYAKGTFDNYKVSIQLIDLTVMFGADISSYLETLTTKQLGDWFKKIFPKNFNSSSYYSIKSCRPINHTTIGFNAFNSETGTARLLGGKEYQITGTYSSVSYEDINGDSETLTIDESGIFTPLKNGILTVVGGNSTNTCVHLVWGGYRNGDFEPYKQNVYPLDNTLTLRGVPKLDTAGNLYFDGDTYESDGTLTRYYGTRDYQSGDDSLANAITNGTTTVYKLETPTIEQADPFRAPQIVDDFGTEEYAQYNNDFMVQGHTSKYAPNLRDKLQNLPNIPENTGDYIVHYDSTNRTCTFVAKTSDLPTLPTADGNYLLKCTVADGEATLTWEAQV